MTYKNGFELIPKGDGTYFVPKTKGEDGTEYVPAQYKNVDKKCKCKETERHYCLTTVGSRDHKHICTHCGGVMEKCRLPWD
jgi:hypothetical protein